LVFIVLALFLDMGLAFWVASGIPTSFMGAGKKAGGNYFSCKKPLLLCN